MTEIRIGGLARLSTCDWPGQLVATVFCQGCPWACPYCHNPHLLSVQTAGAVTWQTVYQFLGQRAGLLDGVVFSGGEPTLQRDLPRAMRVVRDLGYKVGLHTGGPYPDRLPALLPMLDWVGFDVKAAFADYDRVTQVRGSGERACRSLRALIASGVSFQARTTVDPTLLDEVAVGAIRQDLAALGVHDLVLQECRPPPRTASGF